MKDADRRESVGLQYFTTGQNRFRSKAHCLLYGKHLHFAIVLSSHVMEQDLRASGCKGVSSLDVLWPYTEIWADSFVPDLWIVYLRRWNSKAKQHGFRRAFVYVPHSKMRRFYHQRPTVYWQSFHSKQCFMYDLQTELHKGWVSANDNQVTN